MTEAAIPVIASPITRHPDGYSEIVLRVETEDVNEASRYFRQPNATAAIVPVQSRRYGMHAKALRQSSFFRCPDVWRAIGPDAEYQAWTRKQRCVVTRGYDLDPDKGEERCTYCHVRRAGDSGTGFKPEYMGVPMVDRLHQLQHHHGELAPLMGHVASVRTEQHARDWFNQASMQNVQRWGWETLKSQLQFDSWSEIPPGILYRWANQHNVVALLPGCYRPE